MTQLLMPALERSSEADGGKPRVVYVASGGMYNNKFTKWTQAASTGKHTEDYDGNIVYSYTTQGQVLLVERLTRGRS